MNAYRDYLKHHGIKGMRWGVRRYRNEDGTLTPAGKKRYDYEVRRNNSKGRKNRADEDSLRDPDKWVEDDITNRKQIVDSTRNFARSVEELERTTYRQPKPKRQDLSKMSDEEMRKKINRELLERQYNDIFNSAEVSTGRQHVRNILAMTTATLGTVSTGLSIALAIKQLKKG